MFFSLLSLIGFLTKLKGNNGYKSGKIIGYDYSHSLLYREENNVISTPQTTRCRPCLLWRRCQQSLYILVLLTIPLAGTACIPQPTATPTPPPEVIVTFMAAVVTAQVAEEDGALIS
jgi:hypothetical protein